MVSDDSYEVKRYVWIVIVYVHTIVCTVILVCKYKGRTEAYAWWASLRWKLIRLVNNSVWGWWSNVDDNKALTLSWAYTGCLTYMHLLGLSLCHFASCFLKKIVWITNYVLSIIHILLLPSHCGSREGCKELALIHRGLWSFVSW